MHGLVRRYIKTAIAFLFIGLAIGGWMMVKPELLLRSPSAFEVGAHTHAIAVGFLMMMILGVALWMFPRPARDDRRYRPGHVAAAYWILTVATAARILGELLRPHLPVSGIRWTIVAAGGGQIAGLAVFFYAMWSRIRPVGSQVREQAGERF